MQPISYVCHKKTQCNFLRIKFTEAARFYLKIRGKNRGVAFEKSVLRANRHIIGSLGNKDLARYTRANANSFKDYLLRKDWLVAQ